MDDKLLKTVTDELCKYFNDPIDIECSYCEAAKAVIPLVRADMQRELGGKINKYLDDLLGYDYSGTRPRDIQDIISGTFKEGE